jgi:hypothetical protein
LVKVDWPVLLLAHAFFTAVVSAATALNDRMKSGFEKVAIRIPYSAPAA